MFDEKSDFFMYAMTERSVIVEVFITSLRNLIYNTHFPMGLLLTSHPDRVKISLHTFLVADSRA